MTGRTRRRGSAMLAVLVALLIALSAGAGGDHASPSSSRSAAAVVVGLIPAGHTPSDEPTQLRLISHQAGHQAPVGAMPTTTVDIQARLRSRRTTIARPMPPVARNRQRTRGPPVTS